VNTIVLPCDLHWDVTGITKSDPPLPAVLLRQSRRPIPRRTKAAESGEAFPLPQLVAIDDGARNARHIVEDAALDKRVYARVAEQDQRRTIIITARIARDLPSLREQLVDR
jgi:hypothetical protein